MIESPLRAERSRPEAPQQCELPAMPGNAALDVTVHLAAHVTDTPAAALCQFAVGRFESTRRAENSEQGVEGALQTERDFLSGVLDSVGSMVVVYDTGGRIVRFNRACEALSGYAASDLVGRCAWDHPIPSENAAETRDGFERICRGDFPAESENVWIVADGSRRRIRWSATALRDQGGQVNFIVATGSEVTKQRVAEEAIRESEARYRQLVEGSLGMVLTHDLDGVVLSINAHGAEGIGRTIEQVVGRSLTDFIFPERLHLFEPYREALQQAGEAQGLLPLCHTNGEERVMAYRNRLVREPGRPPCVLAFAVDITEQVRAEEQLRALMRQSNSVLESVGDGIYGIDLEGRLTVLNPAAEQMLGYRAEEILGMKMHDLIHHTRSDGTPYKPEDCPIQRSLTNLETFRVSKEIFWRKDGSSFPVEYIARPQIEAATERDGLEPAPLRRGTAASGPHEPGLSGPAPDSSGAAGELRARGRAVGAVVAFTDISERNALDRMKDEFISTVSHELRTPLTSLRAALGLVSGGVLMQRPEKVRLMMDIAIENTDRLVRLVNDILDLESIGSGKAELHSTMTSMDDLFRRAAAQFHGAVAKGHAVFTFGANNVNVWADTERILQLLTNVIANAIKFSEDEEVSEIHMVARYAAVGEALVEVHDNGRGIATEKLEMIFERFQQVDASDSRSTGGTGLGLAICRSIAAQHGGRIWATSELGKGSTFHLTLPTRPSNNLR